MATIPHGYQMDSEPGCGGWVVQLGEFIVWPTSFDDGQIGSQQEAEKVAASLPGAKVLRVDIVLSKAA